MIGIDTFGFDDLEIRVYNPKTKEVVKKFENFTRAGYELGISPRALRNACETRTRRYSPTMDMEIAPRLVNKNKP